MKPCLIQVEFFHVNAKEATLGSALHDAWESTMNKRPYTTEGINDLGPGIKTCLRFYDDADGTFAQLATLFEEGKDIAESICNDEISSSWWKSWQLWWSWRLNQMGEKILFRFLRFRVMSRLRRSEVIAIEKFDHSFRRLRDIERREVLIRIDRSPHFWLFVFAPNDLLADENELVATVM